MIWSAPMQLLDTILLLVKLGWRNILRQKRRSYLVISSAMAGMVGILLTMALINGFYHALIATGIESGLGHVQIRPTGYDETRKVGMVIQDHGELDRLLPAIAPAGVRYSPRLEREGLLRGGSFTRGVLLLGIEPETERGVSHFADWVEEGDFFAKPSPADEAIGIIPCVIGKANADKMFVSVQDSAVLSVAGTGGSYNSIRCRIVGIFRSPMEPFDKYTVLLRRSDLSRLYANREDRVSGYIFLTGSIDLASSLKAALEKGLHGVTGIEILTYDQIEKTFPRLIEISDSFAWIAYLILLMGVALILFDSVTMSIYERMREIGIIRALGSRPAFLFFMVLFESLLLTLAGSLAGIAVGWGITLYFQYNGLSLAAFAQGMEGMGRMGSVVYPFLTIGDFLQSITISLGLSILSGIYPALKVVRISPIQAIYNR